MPENFDEYARRHSEGQANRERLAKETKSEWSILKSFAAAFATDGKEFVGQKFQWAPYPSSQCEWLLLDSVGATFLDHGEMNGVPRDCRVYFDRRPPGPSAVWLEEDSPVASQVWNLEPEIQGESFVWSVPELGETYSSMDLADRIARELGEYHKKYEEHYHRWPAA